ncbi:hypothetical protein DQ04_01781030 [Trypanosoma grayi]|uniref:hypothetical protein n=1 Tax=Trypanosoma grayi TaxID=71804 RepID=UPI0004F474CC|nr:hypothetical protein DQ04_01781030 [Trypanosoma grayi]KEG12339.1 hypothetical protein DQ04_01781030 [Trypanosoma grayi]
MADGKAPKHRGSLISAIRSTLKASGKGGSSSQSGLGSPKIYSDPVPHRFRKTPNVIGAASVSQRISDESCCPSFRRMPLVHDHEVALHSGVSPHRQFQYDKIGLLQLSLSMCAPPSSTLLSAETVWEAERFSTNTTSVSYEQVSPAVVSSRKASMLFHWLEDQSVTCGQEVR